MKIKIKKPEKKSAHPVVCPECGAILAHEGGCVICYNCGWSECK